MNGFVTYTLIAVTALVSWQAFNNPRLLDGLICGHPRSSAGSSTTALLGHGFIHADMQHLLFNMLTLFFFGRMIEQAFAPYIGPLGFALFYLSAIVVAALPSWLRHRLARPYRSLGASGGVTAVLFAFILLDPWAWIARADPGTGDPVRGGYVGYSVWAGRRGGDGVNHSAHLWGAGYGVLFTVMMEPRVIGQFLSRLASPTMPF